MFVVTLCYTATLDEIDVLLPEHMKWLEEGYAHGSFIASGRREPRVGGVILVAGHDRAALEERLAKDPFALNSCVTQSIVEFHATTVAQGAEAFADAAG